MSDYSSLKATINANIKANNNHEITGAITNSVLNAMVNSLGAGYQFMGVATPTNPGSAQTPDYKCFYLATTPGTYTNLGGLVVAEGEVAILKYDTAWTKEVTGVATADQLNQLGQQVKFIADELLLEETTQVNLNSLPSINRVVNNENGFPSWGNANSKILTISDERNIEVIANQTRDSYITFVTSLLPDTYENIEFYLCVGQTGRNTIPANTKRYYAIPNDCKYVYITDVDIDLEAHTPQYVGCNNTATLKETVFQNQGIMNEYILKVDDNTDSCKEIKNYISPNFSVLNDKSFTNISLGSVISFASDGYRNVGVVDIEDRIDVLSISKVMSNSDNLVGVVMTDNNDVCINIIYTSESNVGTTIEVDLSRFSASRLYFIYGTGSGNEATVSSKGVAAYDMPLGMNEYNGSHPYSEPIIGQTLQIDENTGYFSTFVADIEGINEGLFVNVCYAGVSPAVVTDKNNVVLKKLTSFLSSTDIQSQDVYIDLSDVPTAAKLFVTFNQNYSWFGKPSIRYNQKKVSSYKIENSYNQPSKGTLLLHFDGTDSATSIISERKGIMKEYGINKGSFVISPSMFTANYGAWANNYYKQDYFNAIKDGWDVAFYPSASYEEKTDEQWATFLNDAIEGLANLGICNITTFAAGQQIVTENFANIIFSCGFKIIRGGYGSYPYGKDNIYIPQGQYQAGQRIVIKSVYMSWSESQVTLTKNWVKNFIDNICLSKTAGALFSHNIIENPDSEIYIDESMFREIMAYIEQKVNAGLLEVMNFSEWYATINPIDGNNWNTERNRKTIASMQLI